MAFASSLNLSDYEIVRCVELTLTDGLNNFFGIQLLSLDFLLVSVSRVWRDKANFSLIFGWLMVSKLSNWLTVVDMTVFMISHSDDSMSISIRKIANFLVSPPTSFATKLELVS